MIAITYKDEGFIELVVVITHASIILYFFHYSTF